MGPYVDMNDYLNESGNGEMGVGTETQADAGGGFFSNLFQGAGDGAAAGATNWINNVLDGVNLPEVKTDNSFDTKNIMMIAGIFLAAVYLMKKM